MWIWESEHWPAFRYQTERLLPVLEKVVRAVSPLATLASQLDEPKRLTLESQILLEEALSTAKIEGELLDRESVRSSIANRLGIGQSTRLSKSSQAFIDVLLESIRSCQKPLTEKGLFKWHRMLFTEKPALYDLVIGDYRDDRMQVVSGRFGKETVHFQAPCESRACVQKQMAAFLDDLNRLDGSGHVSLYIKAAIAKFWFVTIHPFDDGNGRFSRIIAERLLAQAENTTLRLYSLSSEIDKNKDAYYKLLEKTQKGDLDITDWIVWFLEQVANAAQKSHRKLYKIQQATRFWDRHRETPLNGRQRKLLVRLLETEDFADGISRKKYKGLAHTTDITATRDLKDLTEKRILEASGSGRATKYHLRLQ
ncbi:Fic family protein [Hydrogenovibrio halophilus]|uniref:Fic family protein n=1 Tax=Hydrogenovibrio halophilus TaxID=373391 RepID=UPI00036A10BF|nr:Fic family protein [Hydrogenovibrio halophilus]